MIVFFFLFCFCHYYNETSLVTSFDHVISLASHNWKLSCKKVSKQGIDVFFTPMVNKQGKHASQITCISCFNQLKIKITQYIIRQNTSVNSETSYNISFQAYQKVKFCQVANQKMKDGIFTSFIYVVPKPILQCINAIKQFHEYAGLKLLAYNILAHLCYTLHYIMSVYSKRLHICFEYIESTNKFLALLLLTYTYLLNH